MSLVGDMVVQTANAPGTGTANLIAPQAGRSSFVAENGPGQVFYSMWDAASWEKGIGTVVAGSPDTLSRDTVLGNSLGTTAKINFVGEVTIECFIPAERDIWASADNGSVLVGNRKLSGVTAGVLPDDASRLSQVGNVRAQTIAPSGGVIVVALPPLLSGDTRQLIEIDLCSITLSSDAALYFRLSTDGGNNYLSGAADYYWSVNVLQNGSPSGNGTNGSYAQFTGTATGSFAIQGKIRFDPGAAQWDTNVIGAYQGNYARSLGAGNSSAGRNPTHLVIGALGQTINDGSVRVSRIGF